MAASFSFLIRRMPTVRVKVLECYAYSEVTLENILVFKTCTQRYTPSIDSMLEVIFLKV